VANEQDSGDRTEEPTPKKLQDARDRGDVSKSREIGSTVGLLAFAVLCALLATFIGSRIAALIYQAVAAIGRPFEIASVEMIVAASSTVIVLVLAIAVPVALLGLLAEFLQVGPVFTGKKMEPKLENMDPVKGFKRMFSMDNFVELGKAILKTLVLMGIAALIARSLLPQVATLPQGTPGAFAEALRSSWVQLVAWTVAIFVVIAVADALYQRYSHRKRLRMSFRDIRQEFKESEGDPLFKQHRRQQHSDLASGSAAQHASSAHMLVVNPTHVAIALDYDPETRPVPTVAAKGEDLLALDMREAAQRAGVPMLRDVPLARALLERAEVGETVPEDLFEAVAQAVVWARKERNQGATNAAGNKAGKASRDAAQGKPGRPDEAAARTTSPPGPNTPPDARPRPPRPPAPPR
jgi:type III secretion protein U